MRLALSLVLLCLFTTSVVAKESRDPNQLTPEQIRDGWISLFDGETLYGWQPTTDADWQARGGTIHVDTGEPGFLMTTTEFADYELHVEFKAPATTNSGIFLRLPLEPKDSAKDCYEVNIAPADNPFPTGSLVGRRKFDLSTDNLKAEWTAYPPGGLDPKALNEGWYPVDLVANEGTITVSMFGLELYQIKDSYPISRGHIGLQFNKGEIAFRNIRLKPLNTKPIFNGKDLTGWNTERAEESEFTVTPEGELQVLDGRGQLESEGKYGDFVLQLDCFINGDALNSGVFFRCIPGDFMMGYECQIHNGIENGDPTKPVDCGTGGFFRRQQARRVVAQDREWFAMTLVVDGPHMASWVNGIQVSDWTDTRAPHENPRKGLRTKPGTLAIQGHDPTTDLRFRNLRIMQLPRKE